MCRLAFPLLVAALVSVCSVFGCAHPVISATRAPTVEAQALPPFVVASVQTVLRLADDPKVRIASPRLRLPLKVRAQASGQLVADIDGAILVRGLVKLEDLAVVVCDRGPVGQHFYAGKENLLTLRSAVRDGRVRVAGEVRVRAKPYVDGAPYWEQFRRLAFEAEVAVNRLCVSPVPQRHAGTAEDPHIGYGEGEPDPEDFSEGTRTVDIEKGVSLELLETPGGRPLHTFAPTEWGFRLMRLRSENGWDLVAAGGGPYLVGWIVSRPLREEKRAGELDALVGGSLVRGGAGPGALNSKKFSLLPLHSLPADTEVQHRGRVQARLKKAGYCRVVGKPEGKWSFVVAAVDDDVTVEGWVETAKLGQSIVTDKE
jgi:hypothetical protein